MCDHNTMDSGCCGEAHAGAAAGGRAACHCRGNIPRHFMFPAILLLLDEEPSHGYSLLHKLFELGITDASMSPATVYRILSRMEDEGLTVHEHADDGQGPTRKVYSLTDEGREALAEWRSHIERTRKLLDWFTVGGSRG